MSTNFGERTRPIDTVIIHYTDMVSAAEALACLCNPISKVSCHYLIDEEGAVHPVVEEAKCAWHAGESFWQGRHNLNECSIGIELANPGHSHGYLPFPDVQITALIDLLLEIQSRWQIPSSRILGHSDIAPRRKQDPGALFPWKQLHAAGLGLWPQDSTAEYHDVREGLDKIGYETVSLPDTICAFQRRFQPHKVDGIADGETRRLIAGLLLDHASR